jgi:uncharacterized protein (DUF1501 family)
MNLLIRKSLDRSKPNRRDFLVQSGCASMGITSLVNTLAQLKLVGSAAAQSAPSGYKALICLFLEGGADQNNILIPAGSSSAARTAYASGRGVLSIADSAFDNISYATGSLGNLTKSSRLNPTNAGAYDPAAGYTANTMAVHPGAAPLAEMFNTGELAFVSNIGTLVQPGITRANYSTLPNSYKPPQLFSHSDQQVQWQSSIPDKPFTSGWGGRVADELVKNSGLSFGDLALSVSIAGVNSFQVGIQEQPYIMGSGGVSSFAGYGSPYSNALRNGSLSPDFTNPGSLSSGKYNPLASIDTDSDPLSGTNYQNRNEGWRLRAIEQVLAMSHASLFDTAYTGVPKNARVTEGLVGAALAQSATTVNGAAATTMDPFFDQQFPNGLFNPRLPDFANQLKMVARLIKGRSALTNTRQIFFVKLGGWDTHVSQIPNANNNAGHFGLVNQLSRAVKSFYDAMSSEGLWDNVMMFTASDFNRTLTPNKNDSTGGSDHAWGGHAFIAGGAVKGQKIYGKFPELTVNGGMDVQGNRGRWIPSTAVDQYAAMIAKWFGVSDSVIPAIFPNLGRFMPNLGASAVNAANLDIIDYNV